MNSENVSDDRQKQLGQYPSRVWVAEALVQRHFNDLDANDFVVEPACGPGAFLAAIPQNVPAMGVEIDERFAQMARINTGRHVATADFCHLAFDIQPTAIIGNPPFNLALVDAFLQRAHKLLPEGGRVGFILPAYAFQTAGRVAGYADQWSMYQEMIPRNIFDGLKLPLVFARFCKEQRKVMVGFALYREAADIQRMPDPYREVLSASSGPVWRTVVELALAKLGGEADLQDIYAEIEGHRPTGTGHWRPQIRKVVRSYPDHIKPVRKSRYALCGSEWKDRFMGAGAAQQMQFSFG